MRAMNIDFWMRRFKPRVDTIEGQQIGISVDEAHFVFSATGKDLQAVLQAQSANPNTVWTVIDIDRGFRIIPGMSVVNRIGYAITEVPFALADREVAGF